MRNLSGNNLYKETREKAEVLVHKDNGLCNTVPGVYLCVCVITHKSTGKCLLTREL